MTVDIYSPTPHDGLTLQELDLYHAIMAYRDEHGLAPIPLSIALTTTGGRHVLDTRENIWAEGVELPEGANLHSWSDAYYYDDHRKPEVMWEAPERLGTGYDSPGYEISAAGYEDVFAALEGWKDSPSHDDVMRNAGTWADVEFNAIGIGVETSPGAGPYAGRIFHVWFGEMPDPVGAPELLGTGDDDDFDGTAFADVIRGLGGHDRLSGHGGNDRVYGGDGEDRASGGRGSDRIYGQDGDDRLFGSYGSDRLSGGRHDDYLSGGSGRDRLYGGDGDDELFGGSSGDRLVGGPGADLLTGGSGLDTFVFGTSALGKVDTIKDFASGEDHVDLSPLGDNLRYIGTRGFSGESEEVRVTAGAVMVDVDGDAGTDLRIDLAQEMTLSKDDFIL